MPTDLPEILKMRQPRLALLALACSLALIGCYETPPPPAAPAASTAAKPAAPAATSAVVDPHSYAEPAKVRTTDLALDLALDFANKTLAGTATLSLDWVDGKATQLVLDSRELTIESVEGLVDGHWVPLKFALAAADPLLGSKLTIEAPQRPEQVKLTYTTSPTASGLQWLEPSMTAGKAQPFMFSQSQQIHARSWVPLQDTPQVRITYTAHVTAPADAMVLMSADNDPQAARDGDYTFKMPQKIPSYLLAIAAGDMAFGAITDKAGVWAEPSMVAPAVAEFADTGKMIDVAEKLYGPYRWDRYDILVLPPSFPYGGMENPRLTFATPTVITGDKSLVSLVAHELAHSWSGNLVTFATANDAWLNEGLTSYVENRIIEALYGKERADMDSVIERNELKTEFTNDNKPLQRLAIKPGDLADPDENLTGTVYTKGAWFMQFLEFRYGRERFDAFLRGYFDHFAFQSITSKQFADYAKANLLDKYPDTVTQVEFDNWLYEPGIPSTAPSIASIELATIDRARAKWIADGTLPGKTFTDKWVSQEWVHFLGGMPQTLPVEKLAALDEAYHFTGTTNGEIAQRWYPLTVRSGYVQARPQLAEFISRVGRRKLIMPTYAALAATDEGRAFAREVFAQARAGYHPITVGSVEAVLADKK
jgi:aminopeptidase N